MPRKLEEISQFERDTAREAFVALMNKTALDWNGVPTLIAPLKTLAEVAVLAAKLLIEKLENSTHL
jgi:hypothetical protein